MELIKRCFKAATASDDDDDAFVSTEVSKIVNSIRFNKWNLANVAKYIQPSSN